MPHTLSAPDLRAGTTECGLIGLIRSNGLQKDVRASCVCVSMVKNHLQIRGSLYVIYLSTPWAEIRLRFYTRDLE